jgi:hypothetical protein
MGVIARYIVIRDSTGSLIDKDRSGVWKGEEYHATRDPIALIKQICLTEYNKARFALPLSNAAELKFNADSRGNRFCKGLNIL